MTVPDVCSDDVVVDELDILQGFVAGAEPGEAGHLGLQALPLLPEDVGVHQAGPFHVVDSFSTW